MHCCLCSSWCPGWFWGVGDFLFGQAGGANGEQHTIQMVLINTVRGGDKVSLPGSTLTEIYQVENTQMCLSRCLIAKVCLVETDDTLPGKRRQKKNAEKEVLGLAHCHEIQPCQLSLLRTAIQSPLQSQINETTAPLGADVLKEAVYAVCGPMRPKSRP